MDTKKFNPEEFGATKFNPIAEGATPVSQPSDGIIQSIAKSIASPLLRVAATGAGKEIDVGYLGKAKPVEVTKEGGLISPQTGKLQNPFRAQGMKEAVGIGLELASYLPVVGGATKAAQLGFKGAVRAGALQAGKEGAVAGGLYSGGKALEVGKPAGEVVLDTVVGTGTGYVAGLGLGGATSAAGYGTRKAVQKFTGDVVGNFKDKARDYIGKAIRPSVRGKQSAGAIDSYYDDAIDAVISIKEAKPTFADDLGNPEVRLPRTTKEFADAIDQTKSALYRQYHNMSLKAGEAGVKFDTKPLVRQLTEVSQDTGRRPELRKYALDLINEIGDLEGAAPDVVERRIQDLNSSLASYFNGSTTKIKAELDASTARLMREQLDDIIDRASGVGYQALRNRYKALKTIEKDVVNRAIVDARKNAKGLLDFTDVFSGGQVVQGLLTLNPSQIALGTTQKVMASIMKHLNDPDRYVKNLFNLVDDAYSKSGGTLRPSILPKTRLLLGAPPKGAPQSQVMSPISLPKESGTTQEARELFKSLIQKAGAKNPPTRVIK